MESEPEGFGQTFRPYAFQIYNTKNWVTVGRSIRLFVAFGNLCNIPFMSAGCSTSDRQNKIPKYEVILSCLNPYRNPVMDSVWHFAIVAPVIT